MGMINSIVAAVDSTATKPLGEPLVLDFPVDEWQTLLTDWYNLHTYQPPERNYQDPIHLHYRFGVIECRLSQ